MIPARHEFRDRRNYAIGALSEVAAPLLRAASRMIAGAPATPPASWRRGVIIGNGHIGDVLYRTGSLDALSRGLPDCEWSYLSTPFAAELLHGNPAVCTVLPWMTRAEPESALAEHREALRALHFDVALCTENVRAHTGLLTALAIRVPNRVAFTQKGFSGLATLCVRPSQPLPRPIQLQNYVAAVTGLAPSGEPRPRVYADDRDAAAAAAEWVRVTRSDDASHVVACAVTTRQSIGAFPPELFEGILRRILARDPRARIVLLGADFDEPVLVELARRVGPRAVVSAGRLGLREVVAFLERCDAFLGSDSGPRHLANAAGIPVFFIRNLGTSEIEAGPYVSTEFDLAPRGEFLSVSGTLHALRTIDPDAAAATILAEIPAARGRRADTPR